MWKLHAGNELYSGPLAISAMDYEGCYVDPERAASNAASSTNVDGEDAIDEGGMMMNMDDDDTNNNPTKKQKSSSHIIPPLHPDDEAIINWKGSYGDTSAEQLQQKRDRARAAARLAIAQGYGSLSAAAMATPSSSSRLGGGKKSLSSSGGGTTTGSTVMKLKKKHHLQSRILDEKTPNFMKKTTYLTNDATSVHRFTSLASTQEKRAREVDKALAETAVRYKREDVIERGFVEANSWDVMMVNSNDGGGVEVEEGEKRKKKRRVHPSKKGVYPVWDLPLLPDVPTWGHTYAHVVLDHPPKSVGTAPASGGGGGGTSATPSKNKNLVTARQLQKAIVADVSKQTQNSRMACTVWVPDTDDSDSASSTKNGKENEKKEGEENEETTKNVKKTGGDKGETYQAVQRYDLDVLPLRDPSGPQVHYVWMVDPSKKYVGYHPVGSRVQLSTGRPIIQAGGNNNKTQRHGGGGGEDEKLVTNESIIFRRAIEVDERKEMEKRMAEVDVDMAEKYGLVEDNELLEGGGGDKKEGGDGLEGKNNVDDGDDAEMEKDAF